MFLFAVERDCEGAYCYCCGAVGAGGGVGVPLPEPKLKPVEPVPTGVVVLEAGLPMAPELEPRVC